MGESQLYPIQIYLINQTHILNKFPSCHKKLLKLLILSYFNISEIWPHYILMKRLRFYFDFIQGNYQI